MSPSIWFPAIGRLGQYIGSLFDEIKKRPDYIVDEATHLGYDRIGQNALQLEFARSLRETMATVRSTNSFGQSPELEERQPRAPIPQH